MQNIVSSLPYDDKSIRVVKIKKAFDNQTIEKDLYSICNNYGFLIDLIFKTENYRFTIQDAYDLYTTENIFNDDPIGLTEYAKTRWYNNEIWAVVETPGNTVSLELSNQLKNYPSTTISVERSFSMLNKLLVKDRNFNPNNIKHIFNCYFKKKILNDLIVLQSS